MRWLPQHYPGVYSKERFYSGKMVLLEDFVSSWGNGLLRMAEMNHVNIFYVGKKSNEWKQRLESCLNLRTYVKPERYKPVFYTPCVSHAKKHCYSTLLLWRWKHVTMMAVMLIICWLKDKSFVRAWWQHRASWRLGPIKYERRDRVPLLSLFFLHMARSHVDVWLYTPWKKKFNQTDNWQEWNHDSCFSWDADMTHICLLLHCKTHWNSISHRLPGLLTITNMRYMSALSNKVGQCNVKMEQCLFKQHAHTFCYWSTHQLL